MSEKFRRIASNSGWMIGQNIFYLFVGVIVTAMVARYFGPRGFGQFSYVLSIVTIFTAFSTFGMETLTVRDIVEGEYEESTIIFTCIVIRLIGGLVLLLLTYITLLVLVPDDYYLRILGVILSMSVMLKAGEVVDYWAQAHLKSKITAIVKMISFTILSILKLLVVVYKGSLLMFSLLYVVDSVFVGIILVLVYYHLNEKGVRWKFSKIYAFDLLSKCWYLVISGFMITIYLRIDQVMIGTMIADKSEVGIYSAAARIAEMWYFVPLAIIVSFKSVIMKYKTDNNHERYMFSNKILYTLIIWTGIIFGIIITIFSKYIVNILYGQEFIKASSILIISVWSGTFATLGSARSIWLVCENKQAYTLVYSIIGCSINLILNVFLIPKYGAFGAATSSLITQILNILVLYFFKDTRELTINIFKAFSPIYLYKELKMHSNIKQ